MDEHLKLHFFTSDLNIRLIIYESFFHLFFKSLVFYYLFRSASTCSVHTQEINPLSRSAIILSYFSCFRIKGNDSLIKIFAFSLSDLQMHVPYIRENRICFLNLLLHLNSSLIYEIFTTMNSISYLFPRPLLIIFISYQKVTHFSVLRSKSACFSSFSFGSEMIA